MDLLALRMDLFNTFWYCSVVIGLCHVVHVSMGAVCSQICHISPQPWAFSANINWYSATVFSVHGWLNIHMRCDMTKGTSMAMRVLVCHKYHKSWLDDILISLMNRAAVNCCSAQYYNPATLNNMVFLHKGVWKYWKKSSQTNAICVIQGIILRPKKVKGCLCSSLIEWGTWITVQQFVWNVYQH